MDHDKIQRLQEQVSTVLLGKDEVVRAVLIALLGRGHVLLEDVPGVGKTILTRAIAESIECSFKRIQLTPDLLPADILGVSVYDTDTGEFIFKKGPIFANIILADEINRTTPRTQSALLEAMNESQVTADGRTFRLGPPFMVIATQNPYEFEGTYYLPENQLDRFMIRVRIGYPDRSTERDILQIQPARNRLQKIDSILTAEDVLALQDMADAVGVDEAIMEYILDITEATRDSDELVTGLSPRAGLALITAARAAALLSGRDYVIPDDVRDIAVSVASHRLRARSFINDGYADATEEIFSRILDTIPVPQ